MSEGGHQVQISWTELRVGPALVSVPEDWEVLDSGAKSGLVVLRLPVAEEQELRAVPGYVQPTLVLRHFPSPPASGGVAYAAAEELRQVLHVSRGSSPLAITAFTTESGLPGRAQLLVGMDQRVPFQSSRWFIGLKKMVVEISLTFPATAHPDLVQLGELVALSVRDAGQLSDDSSERVDDLMIPDRRHDTVLRDLLQTATKAGDEDPPRLERLHPILRDGVAPSLPGSPMEISEAAYRYLREVYEDRVRGRFSGKGRAERRELDQARLLKDGDLSDDVHRVFEGTDRDPDLTILGWGPERNSRAEVWIHGVQSTIVTLTRLPSGAEAETKVTAQRELTAAVATVLDGWAGNWADWFVDFEVTLDDGQLERAVWEGASSLTDVAEEPMLHDLFGPETMNFTAVTADEQNVLRWIRSHGRGPLVVTEEDGETAGRLQVRTATAVSIHDTLMHMVSEKASRTSA